MGALWVDFNDYGAIVSAQGLDSAKTSTCIDIHRYSRMTLELSSVDANDSVTAVTMACKYSRDAACATVYNMTSITWSTGTGTSVDALWSHATGTTDAWAWEFDVNALYMHCVLDATGTPAAADTVTVYARGHVD